jgi:AcrR family transcriptional regulator
MSTDTQGTGGARAGASAGGSALSREAFAAAALEFIDANGADALTLRALGDAMGVHYTAVYRYFPGKDELVEAALAHMLEQSGVSIPESGAPRERLLALLRDLRAAFAAHPGMALPNLTAQDEQATAAFVRGALQLLEDMGLSGRQLVVAYQMLEDFHVGKTAYDFGGHPAALERRMRGRRLVGHPALDDISRDLDEMQAVNDEAFEASANALLDACEAMAARARP